MLARVADRDRGGVSRRGLFGLGLSRALDELPAVPEGVRRSARDREAGAPSWGDLRDATQGDAVDPLEGKLAGIATAVVDAAALQPGAEVLVVGPPHGRVAELARERGAAITCAPDPEALPYPDDSFDAVLSAFTVVYAERRDDALAEIFRVARPDGMVSLATWTRSGFMGAWLGLAARHALPAAAPDPTEWGRAQVMREELAPHAGDDAEFHAEVVTLRFASPGAAWLAFSHVPGPVAAAIERLDEDDRERMRLEFTDLLPAPADPADPGVDVDVRVQLIAARAL